MKRTAYSVLTSYELIELTDEMDTKLTELEIELSQRLQLAMDLLEENEERYGLDAGIKSQSCG